MDLRRLPTAGMRADVRRLSKELSERDLRERCLQMAITAGCGHSWDAGPYVKAATEFAAFVTRAPKPPKRKK